MGGGGKGVVKELPAAPTSGEGSKGASGRTWGRDRGPRRVLLGGQEPTVGRKLFGRRGRRLRGSPSALPGLGLSLRLSLLPRPPAHRTAGPGPCEAKGRPETQPRSPDAPPAAQQSPSGASFPAQRVPEIS